jgi:hypothetical protein
LNVPVAAALNVTVNVELVPGATLNGSDGACEIENPVPDTDKDGTETAEIVVCGLVMLNVNVFDALAPTTDCPKLMGVAA